MINRCLLGEEEPYAILASTEESLLKLGEDRTRDQLSSPATIIEKFPGGVGAFLDPSQRVRGLSTGFAKFDEMTGGLNGGALVILAARPSMGKTALALNIAQADLMGSLTPIPGSPFPAGGVGSGAGLASQGAIQSSSDGRLLLAVDAASNQISVLALGFEPASPAKWTEVRTSQPVGIIRIA